METRIIRGIEINGFTLIPDKTEDDQGLYLWFNPGWISLEEAKDLVKGLNEMIEDIEKFQ